MEGRCDKAQALAVLTATRAAQVREGGLRGCLKWFLEETRPNDTNAAFFCGLSLIGLNIRYRDTLDDAGRAMIDEILAELSVWFMTAVDGHGFYYYPNKYMGDLVCAWIIAEMAGRRDLYPVITPHLLAAGEYWRDEHWGWGEHMSMCYGEVLLNELGLLLLCAGELPAKVRALYQGLMNELLGIVDSFGNGVYVPHIRSYSYGGPPPLRNYRDSIRPWTTAPGFQPGNQPPLGSLFHELGWDRIAPPRAPCASETSFPCYGGSVALGSIRDDARLGGMTSFPLMPTAEASTWGLSWQSFPVTFWHENRDWGFLQWETEEGGVVRAHPANFMQVAHIPKALTGRTNPPLAGETFSIVENGRLIALRRMPRLSADWPWVRDRFRLLGATAEISEGPSDPDAGWHQWLLRYPGRTVSLGYLAFTRDARPVLTREEDGRCDWTVEYGNPGAMECLAGLWMLSLEGEASAAPRLTCEPARRVPGWAPPFDRGELELAWPDATWRVAIEPSARQPLRRLMGV